MILTGVKTDVLEEKGSIATLTTTNSTRTGLGTKPGFPRKPQGCD